MSSLQENTAERSPPLSPPDGTAMTSLCNPARSRERCALSLPATSSLPPKGRIAVFAQSNSSGSTSLRFITSLVFAGVSLVKPWSLYRELVAAREGFEVCREQGKAGEAMLILMLTAREAVEDRITDLDQGADDYLTKPFEFRELLARLRALVRRSGELRPAKIAVADLVLDTGAQSVSRAGRNVTLTAKEYALLEYLARNAGRVVGRAAIAEHVWDETFDPFSNLIEVSVNRVRRHIDADSSKPLLHTRRGAGYLFGPLSDSDAAEAADESALPRQRTKAVSPARKSHA